MTTRSELRAQRQETEAVEEPVTKTPARHHFLFRLWGIICLTLLALGLLLNVTLLNPNFVKKEITSSSLESIMMSQVNSSLTQYGISTSVLKKSDTDKLITQAVDQIYAGEKINLDLSSVVNSVSSSVDSQLAQYGLSTSMLPAGSSSAVTNNINSIVNSQLNTPEVSQLITGIKIAKTSVNIILVICLISLVLLIIRGLWQRHFVKNFSWICIVASILYTVIILVAHTLAIQAGQYQADLSPFIVQVANDFQQQAFSGSLLMAGVGIGLFILQLVKRR